MKAFDQDLDPSHWMTAPEAAKYVGVSTATMYRWIHEGKITSTQYGGKWLVSKKDLERWKQFKQLVG